MTLASSSLTSQIDSIKTTLADLLEADRKAEALELFVSLLSQLATDHDKLQHQLRLMLKSRFVEQRIELAISFPAEFRDDAVIQFITGWESEWSTRPSPKN